ncbi:MAG: ABC transporter permease [Paludibacteraceae bacterium]
MQHTNFFIARKLHFDESDGRRMSRPAVRIATAGIAVGLAVMLIAVAVVVGFKQEVGRQVIGFGSHIQITNYGNGNNYETLPLVPSAALDSALRHTPHITHVQHIATKPGIVKTRSDFDGIILKGIDSHFDWTFFREHLVAGDTITLSDSIITNDVLISQTQARLLHLSVGDKFTTYFMTDPIRARRFTVCGIYATTFTEFDKLFILTDIRHIQRLNNWHNGEISQIELMVDDFAHIDAIERDVFLTTATCYDNDGTLLQTRNIKKIVPRVFEWLDMIDMNAWVILALMLAVAGFNMISGLLIIILERTNTIGILKAMGARNSNIRHIFLYQAVFLIGKGMLWGNLIGVALIAIQYYTHLIPLDAAAYYVDFVPVELHVWQWFVINIATLCITTLMLIVPSYIITKIQPAKSIKFE